MSRYSISRALHWVLILFTVGVSALYVYERHAARTAAERFEMAVHSAGAGQWFWDIEKNELRWDARMFELFQCDKQNWTFRDGAWVWHGGANQPPAEPLLKLLRPEDVPRVMSALQKAIMVQGVYQAVYRVHVTADKTAVIRASGQVHGGGRYVTGLCLEFAGDDGRSPQTQSMHQVVIDSALWAADPWSTP